MMLSVKIVYLFSFIYLLNRNQNTNVKKIVKYKFVTIVTLTENV